MRGFIEGVVLWSTKQRIDVQGQRSGPYSDEFVTLFNNGGVEYAASHFNIDPLGRGESFFVSALETHIANYCPHIIRTIASAFMVEPPYTVYLSILGYRVTPIVVDHRSTPWTLSTRLVDDELLFPAALIEESAPTKDSIASIVKMLKRASGRLDSFP